MHVDEACKDFVIDFCLERSFSFVLFIERRYESFIIDPCFIFESICYICCSCFWSLVDSFFEIFSSLIESYKRKFSTLSNSPTLILGATITIFRSSDTVKMSENNITRSFCHSLTIQFLSKKSTFGVIVFFWYSWKKCDSFLPVTKWILNSKCSFGKSWKNFINSFLKVMFIFTWFCSSRCICRENFIVEGNIYARESFRTRSIVSYGNIFVDTLEKWVCPYCFDNRFLGAIIEVTSISKGVNSRIDIAIIYSWKSFSIFYYGATTFSSECDSDIVLKIRDDIIVEGDLNFCSIKELNSLVHRRDWSPCCWSAIIFCILSEFWEFFLHFFLILCQKRRLFPVYTTLRIPFHYETEERHTCYQDEKNLFHKWVYLMTFRVSIFSHAVTVLITSSIIAFVNVMISERSSPTDW